MRGGSAPIHIALLTCKYRVELEAELSELERLVVPTGLVPVRLRDHPRVVL